MRTYVIAKFASRIITNKFFVFFIPDIFHITYILNPGAAFGILQNQRFFFIIIAAIMLGALIYFYSYLPKGNLMLDVGIGIFAGGAAGNLIDRVQTGHVVDFFDFRIWPVFNIADIGICVGVGFIIYTMVANTKIWNEENE